MIGIETILLIYSQILNIIQRHDEPVLEFISRIKDLLQYREDYLEIDSILLDPEIQIDKNSIYIIWLLCSRGMIHTEFINPRTRKFFFANMEKRLTGADLLIINNEGSGSEKARYLRDLGFYILEVKEVLEQQGYYVALDSFVVGGEYRISYLKVSLARTSLLSMLKKAAFYTMMDSITLFSTFTGVNSVWRERYKKWFPEPQYDVVPWLVTDITYQNKDALPGGYIELFVLN